MVFFCVSCVIIVFYIAHYKTQKLDKHKTSLEISGSDYKYKIKVANTKIKHIPSSSMNIINTKDNASPTSSPTNTATVAATMVISMSNKDNGDGDIVTSIRTDTTCPPLPPSIQSRPHIVNFCSLPSIRPVLEQESSQIEGTGYDETMTTMPVLLNNNIDKQQFWE